MKALRCAIYTRKSSEEGLEQDFNSLHAQREACEAYIRSQAGEGWTCIRTHYDDGGISGGTLERPALKALLADINAGKVDVVVVYKVDRLTRSLTDFAKIVEVFDKRSVSFVSITQAFNTTSSMGRLTLNVLLSFAQFEREVTGERIRDKIAASKKKGLWMGGNIPLGYDPAGRTFKVNEAEARLVRHIYNRYLELGSVHLLARELASQGVRSKAWVSRSGKAMGGGVMQRGALYHLLTSRLYLGEITHKGQTYPGQHPAIVDRDLFGQVRDALATATPRRRAAAMTTPPHFPLVGTLFDEDGLPMTPSTTRNRHGKRYRYYVSQALMCGGRRADVTGLRRLPAELIEGFIRDRLAGVEGAPGLEALERAQIRDGRLIVWLNGGPLDWPLRLELRGGETRIEGANVTGKTTNGTLVAALRRAHDLAAQAGVSPFPTSKEADHLALQNPWHRQLVHISFLSPKLQSRIIQEEVSGLTIDSLAGLTHLSWSKQHERFEALIATSLAR